MPPRKPVDPVETPGMHASHSDSKRYNHPAFGCIEVSRVSGTTTLFGSDFEHHNFISVRVRRAELNRDLNRDWHFGKEEIVEFWLSEAQWATFVSSFSVGSGTPITLAYVNGEQMPAIPLRKQEEVFKREKDTKLEGLVKLVDATLADMNTEIGSSLSAKKKEALTAHLTRLRMELAGNLPFVAKSFDKHMEQSVQRAMVEVEGYINSRIHNAGLQALTGQVPQTPRLTSGDDDTK